MTGAILIHGMPSKEEYDDPTRPTASNSHWIPWLSNQLQVNGIFSVAPEIPHPYAPRYAVWKRELERFDITSDTILVGHSCGGGFLVRWLSENPQRQVGKVVLVAPWLNPDGEDDTADFFHFTIDPDLPSRTQGLTVFVSDDDTPDIQRSVEILREQIPGLTVRQFHGYGHFCRNDLDGEQFPELLQHCLGR